MHSIPFLVGVLSLVTPSVASSCCNAPPFSPAPLPSSISNSQSLNGSAFIGSGSTSNPIAPKWPIQPDASLMHGDSGNSGNIDHAGPLGWNLTILSGQESLGVLLWGPNGSLTTGYANTSAGVTPPPRGIAAVDPTNLQILATWFPSDVNETASLAYMEYLTATNDVIIGTQQGHIYLVHRDSCNGNPFFTTKRTIDLTGTLAPGDKLLNSMLDGAGNIWFTTGGILSTGDTPQNSTLVGYVAPDGCIASKRIENQMVENGIAINDTTLFMVTGPSGAADTPNATGYMWSLSAGGDGKIEVSWQVPYAAGSALKPGGSARGSGSTPALLNDQFVVITDNDDTQINLRVYHQLPQDTSTEQLVCQVPLFKPDASANDCAAIVHFDGDVYGVAVMNDYNGPPVEVASGTDFNINGDWNDMSQMAPGIMRVNVSADGKTCEIGWTVDLAVKAVPILSTATGLFYGYTQDTELSAEGAYVWYVVAIDWVSGEVVWKQRAGAGGTFNDNWAAATLGPDGRFYQAVFGGVVTAKDG